MKTIFFCIFSITLLITTSCTDNSLLELEVNPALTEDNEVLTAYRNIEHGDDASETQLGEGDTTIQLQNITDYISTGTNELIVDYSGEFDFSGAVLGTTQQIDLLNPQGNPVSLNFTVNDYTEDDTDIEVVYALGARDLTGWEVKEVQQIIIQDVIVN